MTQATAPFSMSQAVELAGIPRSFIKSLVDEDVLDPGADMRFTFQDLVLLRAARQLTDAGIPKHQILGALSNVRDSFVPAVHAAGVTFRKPRAKRRMN